MSTNVPAAAPGRHQVLIAETGESFACASAETALNALSRSGRKGIPVGCINGGCGVCKVRIVEGCVQPLGPVSRAHVSEDEEAQGYTLACRAAPTAAVRLEVSACLVKNFYRACANAAPAAFSPTTNPPTKET